LSTHQSLKKHPKENKCKKKSSGPKERDSALGQNSRVGKRMLKKKEAGELGLWGTGRSGGETTRGAENERPADLDAF